METNPNGFLEKTKRDDTAQYPPSALHMCGTASKGSGWQTAKYAGLVDGNYLYNRCHLLGFQLTGENANQQNLITGTRYLNVEGMLPFENMVADYIKETDNHVLYRVTPFFAEDNLVADGVLMEAKSVEDGGDGILFNVFCYNVQPGITIDYATGESALAPTPAAAQNNAAGTAIVYVANTNTEKFHYSWCSSVEQINEQNRRYSSSREEMIHASYQPCKNCQP